MPKHAPKSVVILFAEAKERIRNLVGSMLTRRGYTVLAAPNGERALEICLNRKGEIHMVLTNIVMPGMDGFELAAAVRMQRPDIKAIVISSHMDAQILRENPEKIGSVMDGVSVVLENEFLPLNLLKTIEEVLDHEPSATSAV